MLELVTGVYKPLLDFIYLIVLAMVRMQVVFTVLPIFSNKLVSGLVRTGIVIVFAAFVTPTIIVPPSKDMFSGFFMVILLKEALIGLMIGFVLSIFFWVMEGVGTLIDIQSGANNATTFDPLTQHEAGPFTGVLLQIVMIVFILAGGFTLFLGLIFESYRVWPVMSFYPDYDSVLKTFIIQQSDTLLQSVVKFAAPILIILLMIEFGLGLVARTAQQLHVFDLSQPIKFYSAIVLLALFLPFFYDGLSSYMLDISKLNSLFGLWGSKP